MDTCTATATPSNQDPTFLPDVCRLLQLKRFVCSAGTVHAERMAQAGQPDLPARLDQDMSSVLAILRVHGAHLQWEPHALELNALIYLMEQSAMRSHQSFDALIDVTLPMLTQLPDVALDHIEFDIGDGSFRWVEQAMLTDSGPIAIVAVDEPLGASLPGVPAHGIRSGAGPTGAVDGASPGARRRRGAPVPAPV